MKKTAIQETEASKRDRFASEVRALTTDLAASLIAKNLSYGDTALNPIGIFAQGDPEQLIRVRIDDKLSRIRNAPDAFGEDPIDDLLGYLVLLKIARARKASSSP